MLESIFWELESEGRNITDEEIGYILYKNKLKYYVQLRQIRTKNYTCSVGDVDYTCYYKYGSFTYLDKGGINTSSAKFMFTSANELGYKKYMGRAGFYGPEGYTLKLENTKSKAIEQLTALQKGNWIDRSTRVLFVEFILYNQELLNFVFVRIAFEFPMGGGVMTSNKVLGVRIFQVNVNALEVITFMMNIVFMLFIIYYFLLLIIELSEFKLAYFLALSSYIDLCIVFISIAGLSMFFYVLFSTISYKEDTITSRDAIFFGFILSYCYTGLSVVFCLAFIKLFKYLNFNATLWSLSKTLYVCSKEIICLLILTVELYFSFAIFGLQLFGYESEEFSNLSYSFGAMVRVSMGDIDFKSFTCMLDMTSFLFVLAFQMTIYFFFFALFLAIILKAYQQVGLLHQKQKFEMQMLEFTYRKIAQLFRKKYNEPPLISVKEWQETMTSGNTETSKHSLDATRIIIGRYKSQGIDEFSYLTYPQQDEMTYELEYYVKSDYMHEKSMVLYQSFVRLRNIYAALAFPYPPNKSTTREVTIITRMLNDLTNSAKLSLDEKRTVVIKILYELEKRKNILLASNTPMK